MNYSPKQIAKMLGVTTSTVYSWISRKYLMANKVGHRRVITKSQLAQFLSTRK
jgi:excisionase family DNA binding protein